LGEVALADIHLSPAAGQVELPGCPEDLQAVPERLSPWMRKVMSSHERDALAREKIRSLIVWRIRL
jgi:hypothetical protein